MIVNKSDIERRIKGLNEVFLDETTKKFIILNISSDYTYNKAIAIVDKNYNHNDWYATDDKACFKTWNEIDAFIDGVCKARHTNFYEEHDR